MRYLLSPLLASCLLALLSQTVFAKDDDLTVIAGVSYNLKTQDFKIGQKPFTTNFTTIDWSVVTSYESVYLRVNYDQSIKDHAEIDNTINGSGNLENQLIMMSREDMGFTFGYNIQENISLLAGYIYGETTIVTAGRYGVGNFPGDAEFNNSTITITEKGPFIGAIYTWFLKKSGSINVSAAYAKMNGELDFATTTTLLATGVTTHSKEIIPGNANGFSYAIIWSDKLSDSVIFSLSAKSTHYKFDAPAIGSGSDTEFDFNDVYQIISIGFSKFF